MKKIIFFIIIFSTTTNIYSQSSLSSKQANWKPKQTALKTRWSNNVTASNVHKEYPRPQMVRKNWINLNGLWDYSITAKESTTAGSFEGKILVPFPIESALSGVKKQLRPEQILWYKKTFTSPLLKPGQRLLLHFGAVDWQAIIYINGKEVGAHQGGYTSFSYDITDYLLNESNNLVVKVYDPTDSPGVNPHGKQTLNPNAIYYTATSGIWQTVWMEIVSNVSVTKLKSIPNIDKEELSLSVTLNRDQNEQDTNRYSIHVFVNNILRVKSYKVANLETTFAVPIKTPHLWTPDDPYLYNLKVQVIKNGQLMDEVGSYFGMRKISIGKDSAGHDRIFLNNKYTYNLGVLDQGFWPDGLYTAPTDEALAYDIKVIKAMGFNTIRKHIKIEPQRWYYHADRLGILVWQDFVNPRQILAEGAKEQFEREAIEFMEQLYSHPAIITWVLFNERWGAYDQERLTKWVKNYDMSRLVNGHSGELLYVNDILRQPSKDPYVNSDITDVHSYPNVRNALKLPNKVQVLGEFGGLGVSVPGHQWNDVKAWGYEQMTATGLKNKYDSLVQSLKKLEKEGLSASIYTQPYDVETEENGFLTYDREIIKIPIKDLLKINSQLIPASKLSQSNTFFIVKDIDTSDNDNKYGSFLTQYKSGRRDSVFLRRLTLMAMRKKDEPVVSEVGGSYIKVMKGGLTKENLEFVKIITRTSKSPGFALFMKDSAKVNAVLGQRSAQRFLKSIIAGEEIEPFIKNAKPNWDSIQQNLERKYGKGMFGLEYAYGRRMLYSAKNEDWESFGKYYVLYYQTALDRSDYHINNMSWTVFEHIDEVKILEFAVNVSKYNLDNFGKKDDPNGVDTYANLLYKVGRKDEAIIMERKAVEISGNDKVFVNYLNKMLKGEKTW